MSAEIFTHSLVISMVLSGVICLCNCEGGLTLVMPSSLEPYPNFEEVTYCTCWVTPWDLGGYYFLIYFLIEIKSRYLH